MSILFPDFDREVTFLEADLLRTTFWLHSLASAAQRSEAAELPPHAVDVVHSALMAGALLVQA